MVCVKPKQKCRILTKAEVSYFMMLARVLGLLN